jgi:serine/threonine-protein kinase
MELVEGEDLSERIARGPIPLEEALPIALQIAEGLESAHEKGIIHRDLKPANIKLTADGKVKILDFGLAKALEDPVSKSEADELSRSPTLSIAATQAGVILGTAAYMSPEQAKGKSVDRRADIWAFGVVLYEMLTGKQAFRGEDLSDTMAAVLRSDVEWEALERATPIRISRLIRRCLERDTRQRLQHIGEARIGIEQYLAAPTEARLDSHDVKAGITGIQKLSLAAAVLIALGLGTYAGWALRPNPKPPSPIRIGTNLSGDETLYTLFGSSLALSPDGNRLAFVQGTFGSHDLYLHALDRLESEKIQGTQSANTPFFSPDGQWVGFCSGGTEGGDLKKVSVSGGSPVTLAQVGLTGGGTWGPDETIVFGSYDGPLMKVSEAGGTPHEVTHLEEGETSHRWPQFLPGGHSVLFISYSSSGEGNIEVADVESGRRKLIRRGGRYPRYIASGHLLYDDNRTLFAVPFDLEKLETQGEAVPVLDGLMADAFRNGAVQYSVADDGTMVYLRGTRAAERTLVWADEKGAVNPASKHRRNYQGFLRLSPDGKHVAVSINSEGNTDLWSLDLDRDLMTRLTFDEASDANPVWSRDGSVIYFRSQRAGKEGIFRIKADGSGKAEQLLESDDPVPPREISPDGRYLAYCPGGVDIYLLPLEEGGPSKAFLADPQNEASPRSSPDGRWLAYDSDESGRYEVYVRRFPEGDGKVQVSSEGGFRPHWSADGRRLFYRIDDAIWVSDIDVQGDSLRPGKAQRLINLEGGFDQSYEVGKDGKRFLLIQNQADGEAKPIFVVNWFEELKRLVPTE